MKRVYHCFLFLILLQALFYSCAKEYSFEGGLSSGYLIKDSGNNCSLITIAGNYIEAKALSDSNFLNVQVYVRKAGAFTIATNRINGYSFKASGAFNDTGTIQVKIPGTGKPLAPGTNVFTLQYDSSLCEVAITVADTLINVVQTTNPDHFPLAGNNHWSYDDLSYPGDSVIETITGNVPQNGIAHYVQGQYISFYPATNQNYYRKTGSDYYAYVAVSTFTSALDYAPSIYDDMNFLKENLHTGDSWYSNTYSGRTSLGVQVLVLRYLFRCMDADATVMINGKTFLHVYKIQMIPEVAEPGANPTATGEIHTAYYAKGIGLIYSAFFNTILTHPELQIRSWGIN